MEEAAAALTVWDITKMLVGGREGETHKDEETQSSIGVGKVFILAGHKIIKLLLNNSPIQIFFF